MRRRRYELESDGLSCIDGGATAPKSGCSSASLSITPPVLISACLMLSRKLEKGEATAVPCASGSHSGSCSRRRARGGHARLKPSSCPRRKCPEEGPLC